MENTEEKILYEFQPGVFCDALLAALNNKEEKFVLVIEELNRGHVYEIFGNIFQLLDRKLKVDKSQAKDIGNSQYSVDMPKDALEWFKDKVIDEELSRGKLSIPENLYIVCTMNNADAKVYALDTAFKRRFEFAYMDLEGNVYPSTKIHSVIEKKFVKDENQIRCKLADIKITYENYKYFRDKLNTKLTENGIFEDKLISKYFMPCEETNLLDLIVKVLGYLKENVFRGNNGAENAVLNRDYTGKNLEHILKTLSEKSDNALKDLFVGDLCAELTKKVAQKDQS